MEPKKVIHFLYVPWTGLGMYGGFRGNRWLRNRIKVFKQFVIPSLLAQTSKNFVLWCSWRFEERNNPHVKELMKYLDQIPEFKTVHTFAGVCFWDDKYPDAEARSRLLSSLHNSLVDLLEITAGYDEVLMTIQPSDDCYRKDMVAGVQSLLQNPQLDAVGFTKGYMANYRTLEIHEYNPTTNPPFFTIKFPRDIFIDPLKHAEYTGPYKSHEYVGDKLRYGKIEERGFLVGTHGENISTVFNHPFKGAWVTSDTWEQFGLNLVDPLKINISIRKWLLRKLPHRVQRKLRYWFGEKIYNRFYNWIRS